MLDNLTARFEVPKWIRFSLVRKVPNHPARLKLICSDRTITADGNRWREQDIFLISCRFPEFNTFGELA
jgi:hypothetical protein